MDVSAQQEPSVPSQSSHRRRKLLIVISIIILVLLLIVFAIIIAVSAISKRPTDFSKEQYQNPFKQKRGNANQYVNPFSQQEKGSYKNPFENIE